MQVKTIIIEDEPLAQKKLVGFIEKIEYLELIKTFDNAIEAIGFLKNNTIDLIFLDIQMEDFTGIQFLETIKQRPKVIITSAYDKYALKGYELDVFEYLLKPFSFERFIKATDKIVTAKLENTYLSDNSYIFIKTEYRYEKINISEIMYVEGMSEYLRIVTKEKKIMTLQNFKTIMEILPATNFIRVHKSYIIALDKIESVERNRIKINEKIIPVSETYKEEFYKKIGIVK